MKRRISLLLALAMLLLPALAGCSGDTSSTATESVQEAADTADMEAAEETATVETTETSEEAEADETTETTEETEATETTETSEETEAAETTETIEEAEATEEIEQAISADEIYVLEDGYSDNTVRIAAPAGHVFNAESSESTCLWFDLEDSAYAWMNYTLYTDYTAEDMESIYGDSFEIYREFYADVEISGPETVTVGGRNVTCLRVIYTYDDGDRCLDFRAWVEMAEDVQVLVTGYEYDYDIDFSTLLETLVDAIQ